MARVEIDPNYNSPTFSRATAATDIFKKEDIQSLAAAMSTHVHDGAGKGLLVGAAAAGSITNAQLGPDVARDNLLTNGGFEIWQRGNGPFSTNGVTTADRWVISLAGSDTASVSRDTTNVASGSAAAAAVSFTLSGGGGVSSMNQKIDMNLVGSTVTASMMVRTSTANAVRLGVYSSPQNSLTFSSYHTGSGAYEKLSVSMTVPAAQTFLSVQLAFSVSCTAYLDNAMLVVGSQAANYVPMHPADEMARCLRYYELGPGQQVGAGQCQSGITAYIPYRFSVVKAVVPTVTFGPVANLLVTNALAGAVTCTAVSAIAPSTASMQIQATVAAGLVAGNATWMQTSSVLDLRLEANP